MKSLTHPYSTCTVNYPREILPRSPSADRWKGSLTSQNPTASHQHRYLPQNAFEDHSIKMFAIIGYILILSLSSFVHF
jgi:hypothetical protein